MDDIIKIIEVLEDSSVLIHGVTETGVINLDSIPFFKKKFIQSKDGAYVVNLADKDSKGTRCVSLFIDKNLALYFDSFEIEYIPEEVLNIIKDK